MGVYYSFNFSVLKTVQLFPDNDNADGFYFTVMKLLGAIKFHLGYLEKLSVISGSGARGKICRWVRIFVVVPDCNLGNIAGV